MNGGGLGHPIYHIGPIQIKHILNLVTSNLFGR